MKKLFRKWEVGQSLIEIILVIGLSAIILPALLTGLVSSRQGKAQQFQRTQAVYLLNETADAVRSVREKSWTSIAANGTFHPAILDTSWILATGSAVVNDFNQRIVISDVNRDPAGTIVASGGTLDPSSKKINISISWSQPYASTVSANLYMTRYLSNNSFTQTTTADFTPGTLSNTQITAITGGGVTLADNNTEGTFESAIFDPTFSVSYYRFNANVNQPEQTTIKAQVGVGAPVDGSCASTVFNYVGPNGDPDAYFTANVDVISGTIPFGTYDNYQNPNRCFKYKFFFDTTDYNQTPELLDISVNYSP
jgi:type II secretory pathway pseudopilin PulG